MRVHEGKDCFREMGKWLLWGRNARRVELFSSRQSKAKAGLAWRKARSASFGFAQDRLCGAGSFGRLRTGSSTTLPSVAPLRMTSCADGFGGGVFWEILAKAGNEIPAFCCSGVGT